MSLNYYGMKRYRIQEFLQESNGNYSSARLFAFIIVISAVIEWQRAVWFGSGTWAPDFGTVGLIAGVLGIKALQKSVETKVEPKKDEPLISKETEV